MEGNGERRRGPRGRRLTLVACVSMAIVEEGKSDGGVLGMRRPAREEAEVARPGEGVPAQKHKGTQD